MSKVRCDIGKAIVILYENHKSAEHNLMVRKPVSYALYQTWIYIDSVEKEREVKVNE